LRRCDSTGSSVDAIVTAGVRKALDYWNEWRQGDAYPRWSTFDLRSAPVDILPHALVVDVVDNGADFRYRFFGTWLSQIHKMDMTGRCVSEYDNPPYREILLAQYRAVVERRRACVFFIDVPQSENVSFRSETIRLPLSEDGTRVDRIISFEEEIDPRNYQHDVDTRKRLQAVFG